MSTPVPMTLGAYQFVPMRFGFDGLTRDADTSWAEIKVAQDWDAIQWLGPAKEEVEIKGVVFPEAHGGLSSLDGIRSLAAAGQPQFLMSRGGNVIGMFVVLSVKEDQSYHNAEGLPRMDKYSIRLRRYAGNPASALSNVIRLFS